MKHLAPLLLTALAVVITVAVSRTDLSGAGSLGSGVVLQLVIGLGVVALMLRKQSKRQS